MNWFQLRYNIKVYIVRSDDEMDRIKTKRQLNYKDIDFERYVLDIHEQNGIVEAVGKTIIVKIKIIRFSKRLLHTFWRKIIKVAIYLYNKTLQQSLDWKTPYKEFQEHVIIVQKMIGLQKPIFYYLKAYIYKVYIFIKSKGDPDKLGKL